MGLTKYLYRKDHNFGCASLAGEYCEMLVRHMTSADRGCSTSVIWNANGSVRDKVHAWNYSCNSGGLHCGLAFNKHLG
jgi:hypothetical protein